MAWFRLDPEHEDPRRLLDPDRQRSEPWAGTIYGRCVKCGGDGETMHECESCLVQPRRHCPACDGEVRYLARCPACQGSGQIDDSQRDGVSVFPDEDGLYRYMLGRDGDVAAAKLVVLEGDAAEDEDFDADAGAVLIHPTRVVDVREPDRRRIGELRRRMGR
jgi:DnaJ-class molecular chaperone